jgi:segregation and condensation protein B
VTDPIESEDTDHGIAPDEAEPGSAGGDVESTAADEAGGVGSGESPAGETAGRGGEDAPLTERPHPADASDPTSAGMAAMDPEATVNLTGDFDATVNLTGGTVVIPERDDAAVTNEVTRGHLKGLLEALVFASDKPIKAGELAKSATAPTKQVKELLEELKTEYAPRGIQLDEVAGGWIFRTNAAYAPFVRDLTKQKPVKLTRAQIETLAILAYRQPITRPEVDEIRGVDCGPVLKLLLERDLVRVLGKKDEPGRPWLYGTTSQFLEFFGLKSLRDLPTLREFTDLNEESRRTVEKELGEALESTAEEAGALGPNEHGGPVVPSDTLPPGMLEDPDGDPMITEIPPAIAMPDEVAAEAEAHPESGETGAEPGAAELDPEEEFPDDDDEDFDDDDDDDDEDEDEDEESETDEES